MFVGDQRCNGPRCKTCPVLFDKDSKIMVNGKKVVLDRKLNCKDRNVIYVAQCQLCDKGENPNCSNDTYFGQTKQEFRSRLNGHRSCFKTDEEDDKKVYNGSALSLHWNDKHKDNVERMEIFRLGIVKQIDANLLNAEEEKYCSFYKAESCGLNRMACGKAKVER